jgi:mono/diheme cytochrome c family protein
MRLCRCIVSGLPTIAIVLSLFGTARVFAASASGEDQALSNGAALYAVYCSDCHGNAPAARSSERPATDEVADYSELVDIAQRKMAAEKAAHPEDEEWPEWADRPNPNLGKKPDERAEIMNLVVAAIEKAHEIKPQPGTQEDTEKKTDEATAPGFNPMSGATDLSKPQTFYYGTSEEEVFKSIANGTGAAMPGWRTELGGDEAIRDVVLYIRSFWSADWL